MIQKLKRAVRLTPYRIKGHASKVVVEQYDDRLDPILYPIVGVSLTAAMFLSSYIIIEESVVAGIAIGAFAGAVSYTTAVNILALWYYATQPTEVDARWVVSDE
jgi:hypothetical protein